MTTDFESGIPTDWTQDPDQTTAPNAVLWSTTSYTTLPTAANSGSSYAAIYSSNSQTAVKLITSLINKSILENPVLSYSIVQPNYSTEEFDSLRIYYRTSTSGNWTLLYTEDSALTQWTTREISLSDINSNNIQIAFEYNYAGGRGIGIDDIYVGNAKVCVVADNLMTYSVTHEDALLM